jgi:metallo-beta-lactamase class B
MLKMRTIPFRTLAAGAALLALSGTSACAQAGGDPRTRPYPDSLCRTCAAWNQPHAPVKIHGNTYYVGTDGLSAILVTSPQGHVLIDGALPNSAPLILDNVRALGFDVRDVKLILNSHVHFDHAGGLAALQRATGAQVAASVPSAPVLEKGASEVGDPQHGELLDFPPVRSVRRFADGETLRVGPLALTAHLTPGHSRGGTTWAWKSCEGTACVDVVYADSHSPISADGFRFTDSPAYPGAVADFERGFQKLEALSCDILVTPHPSGSALFERLQGRQPLVDRDACKRYAAAGRERLQRRLEAERAGG